MVWSIFVFAVFLAIIFTLLGLSVFSWRRPGAAENEAAAASAVFLFLLLFLGIWAAAAWVTPRGPVYYDVPWVTMLVLGIIVFLFIVALTAAASPRSQPVEPSERAGPTEAATAAGVGVAFWFLMVVLLVTALAGTLS